jgi:putative transport protein
VDVLQDQGWILLLAGAAITTLSALAGLVVMTKIYRLNLLSAMGALTAAMTNPPALAAASNQTETDLHSLAYASTYPVALIFKILLAQVLLELLRHLL